MSSMMENKQLIHVATEIVVLIGVSFYFNQKIKRLTSQFDDLTQRVSEQDDIIQKHEAIIKKLVDTINGMQQQRPTQSVFKQAPPVQQTPKPNPKKSPPPPSKPPSTPPSTPPQPPLRHEEIPLHDIEQEKFPIKITFATTPHIDEISDAGTPDDLDSEILHELEELED